MVIEIERPMSARKEHPAELMIQDVLTSTVTNSKYATIWEYFCLFKFSAALDAEPGFKMVVYRLMAENESVQVASQASALPNLKVKDVTPSALLPLPQSRTTCSRIE